MVNVNRNIEVLNLDVITDEEQMKS